MDEEQTPKPTIEPGAVVDPEDGGTGEKPVFGDARSSKQKTIERIPKKFVVIIVLVLTVLLILYFGAAFLLKNWLISESGFKKPGESTDSQIVFLRSIKDEYQIGADLVGESENDRGCKSSSFAGTTTTTCYKRISWSYAGHEAFDEVVQLANDEGLFPNTHFADAGNAKYFYTASENRLICLYVTESNDPEYNLFTSVVLATGNDDICKGASATVIDGSESFKELDFSVYEGSAQYAGHGISEPEFLFVITDVDTRSVSTLYEDFKEALRNDNEEWHIEYRYTDQNPEIINRFGSSFLVVFRENYQNQVNKKLFLEDIEMFERFAQLYSFTYVGFYKTTD